MKIVVVDYGSGNLRSAAKALERAGREGGLAADVEVSGEPDAVAAADRIVLPGVGAFADCKRGLDAVDGLGEALEQAVRRQGRPFLGVCVGMQLMATRGVEYGSHPGLDWLAGEVVELKPCEARLKVPHMGWNGLRQRRPHPLCEGIEDGAYVYFVHSFQFRPADEGVLVGDTDYGGPVTAMVARDNLAGTQFHPEKSQAAGLRLLQNFLRWRP